MHWILGLLMALTGASCSRGEQSAAASEPFRRETVSADADQAVRLGMYQLTLHGCTLRYANKAKSGSIVFAFPGPCGLSRDSNGAIRIVETDRGLVVAVESSRPAQSPDSGCNTQIRAVALEGQARRLSVQTQTVAQCLPAVWDELMFHAFSAETVPVP